MSAQDLGVRATEADDREFLDTGTLRTTLTRRQVSMMGLGGAIGAGLFVGSGSAINIAGPAVLISYIVAGIIVVLVMAMLAEQVAAYPSSGAFSTFAHRALGRTAGATVGWLYWIQLVVVIAAEATGAAAIVAAWFPVVPQWVWVLVFIVALTTINLLGVANYGKFEYWFAFIKVGAILLFLVVGILAIVGLLPGNEPLGLQNLVAHGGFAPTGFVGIAGALLIVMFAFGGTEVVSIAAAESEDPSGNIRRTMRSVMVRILIFYIGSIFVIVSVLPWDDAAVQSGPFAAVLGALKLPGVDLAMSIIVVVALLSAMNANIYGASRMAFSLGERGMAPRVVRSITRNGVPWAAVSGSVLFSFVTVGLNWAWPDAVLPALLNVVGSTLLIVWTSIAVSQIVLRRRADREGRELPIHFWGFPWLSYTTLALLLAVMVLVMFDTAARTQLLLTFGLTALLAVIAALTQRGGRVSEPAA
ncbi:amino acid permease [Leucobacter musarum]|uniref:amino acid permease n=1 Tax=Leucobacter musarum TaxID=1930747 RepID=UPI0009E89935|nr:amino acid permease [Leucobacter musarum]